MEQVNWLAVRDFGKNPLLIFIPDHRVVNSNGLVGGFAGKWNRKPRLLELEKSFAGLRGADLSRRV
jgi:hypothetical protein